VEYTGCPIATFILQNEPNFRSFQLKIEDSPKKRTQTNPIYLGDLSRRSFSGGGNAAKTDSNQNEANLASL